MPDLTPSLMTEITALAKQFITRFAQPEFISGCKVLSVTDINLYAANNGWIEALCGQHNQQRVRWKSSDTIAVNDYVDVLYFADRRLFEAWGVGGSTAIPAGSGWPFANILTVSTTDPDANYTTIAAAFTAAGSNKTVALDSETFALGAATISPSASVQTLRGLDGETSTLITSSINDAPLLDINQIGMNVIDIRMTHSGAGTTSGILQTNSDSTLLRNLTLTKNSGAPTTAYGIRVIGGSSTGTTMRDCIVTVVAGTSKYALLVDTAASNVVVNGGEFNGTTADIRVNHASATVILKGPRLNGGGLSVGAGTVKGWYYDVNGNIISVDGSGHNGGVWLVDESATLRTKEATLAAAIAASASGDSIHLDTDTYSVSASQNIDTSITIEGDGPETTIYTTSVSNAPIFDITTDNITVVFKDITLKHTGGGTAATGIFSNNSGVTVVLDNAVVEISSGAGTDSRGLWIESGTWILRNGSKITITSGTNKYGIYNDSAAATITIGAGCEVNGATYDVYGDQAGSTLNLRGGVLTNGLITWPGTLNYSSTKRVITTNANDTLRINAMSSTDFVATINGTPSGANVTYNAPSSGAADTIVPSSSSQAGKIVLWNTTRSTSALISSVNTGTKVITLTATTPAGWASGDTITARSQTATTTVEAGVYLYELDLSGLNLPQLTQSVEIAFAHLDSAVSAARYAIVHPFQADPTPLSVGDLTQGQGNSINDFKQSVIALKSNKICFGLRASGTGTGQITIRIRAVDLAA